jgi:hypothetical protein
MSVKFSIIRIFMPPECGPVHVDFSDVKDWIESSSRYTFPDEAFSQTLDPKDKGAVAELFLTFKHGRDALAFKLAWHGEAEQVDLRDWERVRKQVGMLPPGINRQQITQIVRKDVDIY